MKRNDSLKSVDPRRGFKPEVHQATTTPESQLAEAREMLSHYVNELRQAEGKA